MYLYYIVFVYSSTPKTDEKSNQIHNMYWMEIVTRELPPCIIIQGNTIETITACA